MCGLPGVSGRSTHAVRATTQDPTDNTRHATCCQVYKAHLIQGGDHSIVPETRCVPNRHARTGLHADHIAAQILGPEGVHQQLLIIGVLTHKVAVLAPRGLWVQLDTEQASRYVKRRVRAAP